MTTKVINPAGGEDYTSIDGWNAGAPNEAFTATWEGRLVEDVFEPDGGNGYTDAVVDVGGYSTPTYYCRLYADAADRHDLNANPDTGAIIRGQAFGLALEIIEENARIDGLCIQSVSSGSECLMFNTAASVYDVYIENCLIEQDSTWQPWVDIVACANGSQIRFGFNVFTSPAGVGSSTILCNDAGTGTIWIYNNTLHNIDDSGGNWAGGILENTGMTVIGKNNIAELGASAGGDSVCYSGTAGSGSNKNMASDTSTFGTNDYVSVTATFVAESTRNLRLTNTTANPEVGENLTSDSDGYSLSTDILGQALPAVGDWSLGAHALLIASAGIPIPVAMNSFKQRR